MVKLYRLLLQNLLARKSSQWLIGLSILAIGIFSSLSYQDFIYLQAQNISRLSVFNQTLKPIAGLVLVMQLLLICLAASLLFPYFSDRGQRGIFIHSPLSTKKIAATIFITVTSFGLFPLGYFLIICISYSWVSNLDLKLLFTTNAALLFSIILYSPLVIATTLFFKKTLTAFGVAFLTMMVVFVLDLLLSRFFGDSFFSINFATFIHLRDGLLIPTEIFSTILWFGIFYLLMLIFLSHLLIRKNKFYLIGLVISALLLLANGTKQIISIESHWDISRAKLSSLDNHFVDKIQKISSPILITAVIDDEKNHHEIQQAFEIIKQYHPQSHLKFSNRQAQSKHSNLVDQFISIEINGQRQNIRYPFDENAKMALAQAIIQLTTRSNQWITFVEGHNEASPFGKSNRDLTKFYQSLVDLGWPIAVQNLSKQTEISSNTKLLVIADSQTTWLSKEIDTLVGYLAHGGNLLLLLEENSNIPNQLRSLLALKQIKGTLIDWNGYQSGTPHPAIVIINQFEKHPINTGINSLLAFPWSSGLNIEANRQNKSYIYKPLLKTNPGVWTEFDSQQEKLAFNADQGELQGQFLLAYTIENNQPINSQAHSQRLAVIGDSSFLSDAAINNYQNSQFAINLINWLSSQPVALSTQPDQDRFIKASPWVHWLLKWGFSLAIPLLLLILFALRKWLKRNG